MVFYPYTVPAAFSMLLKLRYKLDSNPTLLCSERPTLHLDTVRLPAVRNRLTVGQHFVCFYGSVAHRQVCRTCADRHDHA
jgi:hypothetical protein